MMDNDDDLQSDQEQAGFNRYSLSRSRDRRSTRNSSHQRHDPFRRNSTTSQGSYYPDVEMAEDEIFSGPIAESVPTSISFFGHRRERGGSTASFAYYDEDGPDAENEEEQEAYEFDDAIVEEEVLESGELVEGTPTDYRRPSDDYRRPSEDYRRPSEENSIRSASIRPSIRRRNYSSGSRRTTGSQGTSTPLLNRRTSSDSQRSVGRDTDGRISQKIYLATEDMTIVIAGFTTSSVGYTVYMIFCVCTFGLAYLFYRWLPRWRVKLLGNTAPLGKCDWVVVENQWHEMAVHDLSIRHTQLPLSSVFGTTNNRKFREYDEYDDPVLDDLRILDYRYIRFCYNPIRDKFVLGNAWKDQAWTSIQAVRGGIDADEQEQRTRIFGYNLIDLEEKSTGQLLVDEALHPFYIFQIASLILWSADKYYYYAGCILLISVISIASTLIETKSTMKRLREISRFNCDVRVLRSGFWRHVESSELVPGDVYEVTDPNLTQFPCDSLLLSGDCIVNESMLTGESVPVSKTPSSDQNLELLEPGSPAINPDVARHFLFGGTKIIRARRPQDDKGDETSALGLVVRTGFNTTKGALIRSMLFPKPSGFKFYRDSFRYISVMAGIAAIGFSASLINFIRLGLQWHLIVVRALDLITIVVPPALPATLTIGTNFALSRLKAKSIFCISPQRVNVGGKLDVMCFDKTGTLTEEGLDVLGLRTVQQSANRFSELISDPMTLLPVSERERDPTIDYAANKAILYTMATCHTLKLVDGILVGDPLDMIMFEFTNWRYEEGTELQDDSGMEGSAMATPAIARPQAGHEYEYASENQTNPVELQVLKQFDFVSQLRRASVIVQQAGEEVSTVYVKGAPECMSLICKKESFPSGYEELLGFYTHRGFRVIACATKTMSASPISQIRRTKREEAESDLDFVGFIIFENKLKPITTEIIEELNRASIRTIMCTGDNILTAVSVGRECRQISPSAHCFVPRFVEGDARTALSKIVWESVDNPMYTLDEKTLTPLPPPAEHDASLPYDVSNLRNYTVAVSGDVFRWLIDFASPKVMRNMLVVAQIYARMSPDEKHELVEKLQGIDYTVGFCGDGANDCGALKAADVGISLSEAEASVAAPFTSRVFDISCVPQVIREGRAALVTSFSCFKYMSLYSAIQFASVSFLYVSASNLGDFQYLYIDLFLILPIAIFMGWSKPFPRLSKKRPTASLVSRKVLTPLLGQIVICVLIQSVIWWFVRQQSW